MTNPYDIQCLETAASVLVIWCLILNFQRQSESNFLSTAPRFSKEQFSLDGYQASTICPAGKMNMWMNISMENWWSDTDRRKP